MGRARKQTNKIKVPKTFSLAFWKPINVQQFECLRNPIQMKTTTSFTIYL